MVPRPLLQSILFALLHQPPKESCDPILFPQWCKLEGELLAAPPIFYEAPLPSPRNSGDDGAMVRIVKPRLSKAHTPKCLRVYLPGHNIIWLGVVPPPPPLLPPSPPCPRSLSSALALNELARHVGDVDFVKKIRDDLLPLSSRVSEIDVEISEQQWLTVGGASSPGGVEVIQPRCVSGGEVCTHHEIAVLPCD